ncbi:MAG: AAA family ATPase [Betaproteobacteria bacterium]|nr:AAA family ATPase [Betaproteobacteria bacterium]
MDKIFEVVSTRGSMWHRWDPHIHAPGTALNDQYKGADPWNDFLTKVENSDPPIRVLGITDYCGIDGYVETISRRNSGRLAGVGLIFPNVEFRLSIETNKGSAINIHLLFAPDAADHVDRIRHFLDGLAFKYLGETFRCNRADLTRLGRIHNPQLNDDVAAYREGVTQFKISLDSLRDAWMNSHWAQGNCLIAVAGSGRDGTAGLQGDSGQWEATRKNIEGLSKIIFTANPKTIDFYLGKGSATLEDLETKWGGCKPCLHGSDAHEADRVGLPDDERRCWLNGDLTFETLRQAIIEPERRVYIGAAPPRGALPGNCMRFVEVTHAPWMCPSHVPINAGMVAIIGARGSGKTALADMIATGSFGVSSQLSKSSFLHRAAEFLTDSNVKVTWEAGEDTENAIAAVDAGDMLDAPHVQYLSQQFVEQLCSSEGLDDSLVAEIQRLIFNAHPEVDRMGAEDFASLLSLRLERAREFRERQRQALERAADAITAEQLRKDSLKMLAKDRDEKKKALDKDRADRKLLVPKGQEQRAKRLEAVATAVEGRQRLVSAVKLKLQALSGLAADVDDFRTRRVSNWVADLKERRSAAGLSESDWSSFGVQFSSDVDALLKERVRLAQTELRSLEGPAATDPAEDPKADPAVPLIAETADLAAHTLRLLERERDRLQRLVGVDEQNARRYRALSEKITKAEAALAKVVTEIDRAGKADEALKSLRVQRNQAYQGIFEAVVEEERELGALYAPLKARIASGSGAVAKLSFSVRRTVDMDAWTQRGEALLDLRTAGPFRGKGELGRVAESALGAAWRQNTAADVATAMNEFVAAHGEKLLQHMPAQANRREWARKVVSWLYGTDHIQVEYGLQYDGVDIECLSPGTRGIVLLLLYLAIDADDDRPLIIDQPEENLDPQSVFDELVPVFREAKKRRQIIIVTHNANLVVNTDVDQVIIARCGPHRPGQLPEISYQSGGLENQTIRLAVCAILEGGERAFRERAKRLRVSL